MARTANPLRADPTRTTTIRRVYETNLRRAFRDLANGISRFVSDGSTWDKLPPAQKISMFSGWISREVSRQFTSGNAQQKWAKPVADAFKFGADRAFADVDRKRSAHSVLSKAAVQGAFQVRPSVSLLTANTWDESKHPRDERGRFADTGSAGTVTTGMGRVQVQYDREITSQEDAARFKKWLDTVPQAELAKSVAKHIEVFSDPEDMRRRMAEVGIDPEIGDSGEVRGAFDFDTKTLYATSWNGYEHNPHNLLHELGHSITGMDEDRAEAWAQSHMSSVLTTNKRMGDTPQEVLDVLAGRNFTSLSGLTSAMANTLQQTLHDHLTKGSGAREVARALRDKVGITAKRAEVIARTEVIRAFAEGQLTMFDKLGVTQVGAQVEWSTARDGRVCPECADMEGEVYDVEDARGKIPLHPNCRCAWLPHFGKGEAARFGEDTAEEGQAVIDEQDAAAELEQGPIDEPDEDEDVIEQQQREEDITTKRDEITDALDAGDFDRLSKLIKELKELEDEGD